MVTDIANSLRFKFSELYINE